MHSPLALSLLARFNVWNLVPHFIHHESGWGWHAVDDGVGVDVASNFASHPNMKWRVHRDDALTSIAQSAPM